MNQTPRGEQANPESDLPMAVGLMVVGDEILSGKRQDKHFSRVVSLLAERGIELSWAHFVRDDAAAIAEVLRKAMARGDAVLSCGGIGATPDDQTRQGAALAFGLEIARHPEAAATIERQYGASAAPNRLKMADFPAGASLIPNPVNQVPKSPNRAMMGKRILNPLLTG